MSSEKKYILMSIKPKYAEKVKKGSKTIELRKHLPHFNSGDVIIFYESSPVCKITFLCEVTQIISMKREDLWRKFHHCLGILKKDYEIYYGKNEIAFGIVLDKVVSLSPQSLEFLFNGKIKPPQSYLFLSEEDSQLLMKNKKVCISCTFFNFLSVNPYFKN